MNTRKYQSELTGEIVEAAQVARGHRQSIEDYNGDRVTAIAGDWVIFYPWIEVVDDESFSKEYIEL